MQSLGTAIETLVQKLGIRRKLREYEAVVRWAEIVGERVARVTEALTIKKGVLVVHVSNGPWRNELQLLKAEIIGKVNQALGEEIVKDIRFT